jgi:hypothetical protein
MGENTPTSEGANMFVEGFYGQILGFCHTLNLENLERLIEENLHHSDETCSTDGASYLGPL